MTAIAGTGHRPDKLGGYTPAAYDKVLSVAMKAIIDHQPDDIISGMALGWDQALAEAAYLLDVPFSAYIPFEGQESKWPTASRRFYRNLIAQAQKIVVCSPGGYDVRKMQIRNARMVDDCSYIFALWNGTPGGTGNCIEYADAAGVEVINFWAEFEAML